MPASAPRLVPFRDFLKLKSVPKTPPILFMSRRERARFLAGARRMKWEDLRPQLNKGSIVVELTPFPDGDIMRMRCWSKNPEELCIPQFGGAPGHVQIVGCKCINTGPVDDGGGGGGFPGPVFQPPKCSVLLTATGLTCTGECPKKARCKLRYAPGDGGSIIVTCVCTLPDFSRIRRPS